METYALVFDDGVADHVHHLKHIFICLLMFTYVIWAQMLTYRHFARGHIYSTFFPDCVYSLCKKMCMTHKYIHTCITTYTHAYITCRWYLHTDHTYTYTHAAHTLPIIQPYIYIPCNNLVTVAIYTRYAGRMAKENLPYVCMYVCMYIMYVCIYLYIYIYNNIYIHTRYAGRMAKKNLPCICMYMYVCIYVCMYVCLFLWLHTHTYTHA
jgi:hypothetical protein